MSTSVSETPSPLSSTSPRTVLSTKESTKYLSTTPRSTLRSPKPLSLNDYLFVEACLNTIKKYGHVNRIEAYQTVYPTTTYNSAKASAWKKFTNPAVQEAIDARLRAERLTKKSVISVLWGAVEAARLEKAHDTVIAGCVNTLKALGEWTEKQEVKSVSEAERETILKGISDTLSRSN